MRRFGGLNREHLPQFAINLAARENDTLVVLAGHAVQNGILVGRAHLHSLDTFCGVRAVAVAQAVHADQAKPFLAGDHAVIREAEIASGQSRCFLKLAFHVVEGGVVVSDGGADARRLAAESFFDSSASSIARMKRLTYHKQKVKEVDHLNFIKQLVKNYLNHLVLSRTIYPVMMCINLIT